jgi:hypothetical protein
VCFRVKAARRVRDRVRSLVNLVETCGLLSAVQEVFEESSGFRLVATRTFLRSRERDRVGGGPGRDCQARSRGVRDAAGQPKGVVWQSDLSRKAAAEKNIPQECRNVRVSWSSAAYFIEDSGRDPGMISLTDLLQGIGPDHKARADRSQSFLFLWR